MLVLNEAAIRERLVDAARDAGLSVIAEDESGTLFGPDGSFAVPRAPERRVEIPASLALEGAETVTRILISARPYSYNSIIFGKPEPTKVNGNPPVYFAYFMKTG